MDRRVELGLTVDERVEIVVAFENDQTTDLFVDHRKTPPRRASARLKRGRPTPAFRTESGQGDAS